MSHKHTIPGICLLFFMIFLMAHESHTQEYRLAVLPFKNNTSSSEINNFIRGLPDILMTNIGKSEKITLLERYQINKALDNFAIEQTGIVDQSTAVKIGKWLGATEIVIGSVTSFGSQVRIDSRVIDVQTGRILKKLLFF